MDGERLLTIGEAAAITELSAHTLRYYERIGLLDPIQRERNGHRRYRRDDLTWIQLMVYLRRSGMPIRTMQRFAALQRRGDPTGAESKQILEEHRDEIIARQAEIARYLAYIEHKLEIFEEMRERWDGVLTSEATANGQGEPPESCAVH